MSKNLILSVPQGQQRVVLHFLGAARRVTGSMHLLEIIESTGIARYLVDAGTHVEDEKLDFQNRLPKGVTASMIDGIILTHVHGDHSFYVGRLVKLGFSGKIYCIDATADLLEISLLDCARILAANARRDSEQQLKAFKTRQQEVIARRNNPAPAEDDTCAQRSKARAARRIPGSGSARMSERALSRVVEPKAREPLFSTEDAQNALNLVERMRFNTKYQLHPSLNIEFFDADHLLGAATIHMEIGHGASKRTINFGGNVGRHPAPVPAAQYRVTEATYGNRLHIQRDRLAVLSAIINSAHERALKGSGKRGAGVIVVPAFSIGRAQIFLNDIRQLMQEKRIPSIPVFFDSPMAIRVTDVYRKYPQYLSSDWQQLFAQSIDPFTTPNLTKCETMRKDIFEPVSKPILIVTSSGMCNAGRAPYHIQARGSDDNSTFLLIGFQAPKTTGEALMSIARNRLEKSLTKPKDRQSRTIRLLNQTMYINATIEYMPDYSGHGDSDNLVDWLAMGPTGGKRRTGSMQPTVFIEHGDDEAINALKAKIESKLHLNVVVPNPKDMFIL